MISSLSEGINNNMGVKETTGQPLNLRTPAEQEARDRALIASFPGTGPCGWLVNGVPCTGQYDAFGRCNTCGNCD